MDLGKLSELEVKRECRECGAMFESDGGLSAMQKHVDHLRIHQPTAEQWTVAYNRIQEARERPRRNG